MFIVSLSDLYTTHESHLARIDFNGWTRGKPATPEIIFTFDDRVRGLNGSCLLGRGVLALAEEPFRYFRAGWARMAGVRHDRIQAALAEQLDFYRRAAASFDGHKGDMLLDEATNRLRGVMDLSGDVLEIACGAGQWTKRLAGSARFLTAIDAAPEMVEFARRRLSGRLAGQVEIVCADVFDWRPRRPYQAVLFAFWLSHVPPARFEAFWELVATSLAPDGVAVFIDDGPGDAAFEEEDPHADSDLPTVIRRLPASKYRVVKVLYDPEGLMRRLEELGWAARVEPLHVPSPGREGVFVGWARRTMTRPR